MPGIYVHIPFCRQKCTYCGFYSSTRLGLRSAYLDSLHRELAVRREEFSFRPITSLYFGGGTPSLLQASDLQRIIDAVASFYGLASTAEITLEANPDHLSASYVQALADTKINRLSLGVQSFDDGLLRRIRRPHTAKQTEEALEQAEKYGFHNISVDLIYGLPGSTTDTWASDLSKVSGVPHLSCYQLSVEEGSVLSRQLQLHRESLPEESVTEAQYRLLLAFAEEHGFRHYEVSNFCKGESFSRHNRAYWQDEPYLGLGPAAHSYFGDRRQWNFPDVETYIRACSALRSYNDWKEQEGRVFGGELLSRDMKYNEYLMTSLRTEWGCNLSYVREHFGAGRESVLRQQLQKLPHCHIRENCACLDEEGLLFADGIAASLFV